MKIYLFLSIVLIGLVFHSGASAQTTDVPIFLEPDRLFKNLVLSEDRYVNETDLENFGRYMNNVASSSLNTYKFLATTIIDLQKDPRNYMIRLRTGPVNASRMRQSVEADTLIIEYVIALYKPSKTFQDDPFEAYLRSIQTSEARSQLRIDLDTRLGKGVEREKKAAEILKEIKENFTEERLDRIRSMMINGSPSRLPYPLCLITKNCPK